MLPRAFCGFFAFSFCDPFDSTCSLSLERLASSSRSLRLSIVCLRSGCPCSVWLLLTLRLSKRDSAARPSSCSLPSIQSYRPRIFSSIFEGFASLTFCIVHPNYDCMFCDYIAISVLWSLFYLAIASCCAFDSSCCFLYIFWPYSSVYHFCTFSPIFKQVHSHISALTSYDASVTLWSYFTVLCLVVFPIRNLKGMIWESSLILFESLLNPSSLRYLHFGIGSLALWTSFSPCIRASLINRNAHCLKSERIVLSPRFSSNYNSTISVHFVLVRVTSGCHHYTL